MFKTSKNFYAAIDVIRRVLCYASYCPKFWTWTSHVSSRLLSVTIKALKDVTAYTVLCKSVHSDGVYFSWCHNHKTKWYGLQKKQYNAWKTGWQLLVGWNILSCWNKRFVRHVMYVLPHYTFQSHTKFFKHTVHVCVCVYVCVCVCIYIPVHFSMAVPSSSMTVGCFLATCKYYNTWKFKDANCINALFLLCVCVCVCVFVSLT
jgi:hypothetical protein